MIFLIIYIVGYICMAIFLSKTANVDYTHDELIVGLLIGALSYIWPLLLPIVIVAAFHAKSRMNQDATND